MTEVGIESRTLKVELSEPRKRKQTTLVMSAESMSVNSVSWIASWMKMLLSKFTSILMSGGSVLRSSIEARPSPPARWRPSSRHAAS